MREEVTALLENRNELLTITYFKIQELFDKKYGENALVLMEIGTFFEVYEVAPYWFETEATFYWGKGGRVAALLDFKYERMALN